MPGPSIISPELPAGTGNASLDAYTKASLGALSDGVDYTQTPTYKSLMSLLGPAPGGGLNPGLMAQYNTGAQINEVRGQGQKAAAMSGAQGRGLGGSSIEAQGVENADFNTGMADTALLSSLYGQQGENTRTLAGDLFGGSNMELSSLLSIYESAGTSAANMDMYSKGLQEALAAAHDASQSSQNAGIIGAVGSVAGGALAGGYL